MCKLDNTYLLKIGSSGTGVHVIAHNKLWQVTVPPQLQGRPCNINVVKGSVVTATYDETAESPISFSDITRLWVETDISMQGFTTVVVSGNRSSNLTELFDVDLSIYRHGVDNVTSPPRNLCFRSDPASCVTAFRCPGGLPPTITFAAFVDGAPRVNGYTFNKMYPVDFHPGSLPPSVEVDFTLSVEIDENQ